MLPMMMEVADQNPIFWASDDEEDAIKKEDKQECRDAQNNCPFIISTMLKKKLLPFSRSGNDLRVLASTRIPVNRNTCRLG